MDQFTLPGVLFVVWSLAVYFLGQQGPYKPANTLSRLERREEQMRRDSFAEKFWGLTALVTAGVAGVWAVQKFGQPAVLIIATLFLVGWSWALYESQRPERRD